MNSGDVLMLVWGTLLLYVPGLVAVLAVRRVPPGLALAGAPVVTLGIWHVVSLVTGLTGLPFGLKTALGGTLVVWAVLVAATRAWRRPLEWVRPRLGALAAVGLVGVGAAVVVGVQSFGRGLGTLSVLPQEHDMIIHTQLVARIMRTGEAAPWQSYPGDLVSGQPEGFYPNSFHQFAALIGSLDTDPVTALNTASVVLLAVALPVGVAALGRLLRPRSLAPLIGAGAALTAAVSYRPVFALMHDGGALSNAAALAVAPGVIALLLGASRLAWAPLAGPLALAMVGTVALHPSSLATVGITVALWLLVEGLRTRAERADLLLRLRTLAAGGVVAVVLLVPFLASAVGLAGTVTGFSRDFVVQPFNKAVGITLGAPYGGFLDEQMLKSQGFIALLFLAGLVACLLARANAAFVAVSALWATVLLTFLTGTNEFFPMSIVTGVFYNSYPRISGVLSIAQWLGVGIALASAVWGVQRALAAVRADRPALRPLLAAAVLAGVTLLVYVPYADVNGDALATRYATPDFVRVDGDDLAAARYVADRIEPGERVMNNANDGSTYGYVMYGLPLVESAALGSAPAPYTVRLLIGFDELNEDASIRRDVCQLDIAWVVADSEAPSIWAPAPAYAWVPGGYLTVPPGLSDLATTDNIDLVQTFGSVSVYTVDRAGLGCASVPG